MSKIVSLASITVLFSPTPECPWVFSCPKNAMFDNFGLNAKDLYYIVYPNSPKKYEEIQHGQITSIFAFQKVSFAPIDSTKKLQDFMYELKKQARVDKNFFARTITSNVSLIDNDPRIEYEIPPESPLSNFANLSNEVILMTKLPPEIDESIAERIAVLSESIIYFGHITGLYIFATITGPGQFQVRQYTGDDNERYETMFAYAEVDNNQITAYVELDEKESVMINKKMVISHPNFAMFIRDMFNFDSKKYIQMARASGIGQKNPANTEDDDTESDDDVYGYFGMSNKAQGKSMIKEMMDMYGNPVTF